MTAARDRAKGNVQADVKREAYSVRELAAALGYSLDTIYRGMHAGEIPFFKLRGEYRVPRAWLTEQLSEAAGRVVTLAQDAIPDSRKLLTASEAAGFLSISAATLRLWRLREEGPPYVQVGRLVRYRPAELESWASGQAS